MLGRWEGAFAMQRFLRMIAVKFLVGATFVYPLVAPPSHRIDEAHFRLIRAGMTEAEVEGIFGVPAGVYDWVMVLEEKYQTVIAPDPYSNAIVAIHTQYDPESRVWISRHGIYGVTVDQENCVRTVHGFIGGPRIEPPWKRWLRVFRTK
jgi:hypothetical protein